MYLCSDTSVRYIEDGAISLGKDIPAGIYSVTFSKYIGTYLEKNNDYSTEHGKIYGDSNKIAGHIVSRYSLDRSGKNIGVLFSGGKGLGKSLTVRLIIEQLKETHPVIIVSEYYPDLTDFLSHVKNAIIVFDEFEKTMSGNIDGSDNKTEAETKQESFLSLLDGTSGINHNLYILTCNSHSKIDSNMISRPGRIKYHYKFEAISDEAIREYCEDNLNRKELINEAAQSLSLTRFVSIDIVSALVEELNMFPDVSVEEAMNYLNIVAEDVWVIGKLTFKCNDNIYVWEDTFRYTQNRASTKFNFENNLVPDDSSTKYLCFDIIINSGRFRVPKFGWIDITKFIKLAPSENLNIEIISLELKDVESDNAFYKTF